MFQYCSQPIIPEREFDADVDPGRISLILSLDRKWVNGTNLHYYFFDKPTDGETVFFSNGTSEFRPWTTNNAEKDIVRQAFQRWKDVGIGLEFTEVASRDEAEIRIGFMRGDGAWSYIGRDILGQGPNARTMNFGWDLRRSAREIDTAVHEIGHTLGFPHEHQNPLAGIVWNEEAVYTSLAGPPNRWDRQKTFNNIISKIRPDTVQASNWDANSVMHYPFEAGLIKEPAEFRNGLNPAGGLSERDKTWVKTFYPPLNAAEDTDLITLQSIELSLSAGQQRNFNIQPTATRYYNIQTFGESDTVIVLFEDVNGEARYLMADDDSGESFNASLRVRLHKGRKYILRVRLYSERSGETAVMMW
ncbi:MAG TPA: M12 family metallopeptidase [Pyrinomonadaceae bacterium]